MKEENKKLIRKTLIVSLVVAVVYLLVSRFDVLFSFAKSILAAFSPLFVGVIMAVILNGALVRIESLLAKKLKKPRLPAIILTYVLAAVLLGVFITIVIPQFYNSAVSIVSNLSKYSDVIAKYINDFMDNLGMEFRIDSEDASVTSLISSLSKSFSNSKTASEWIQESIPSIFSGITSVAGSIIGAVVNFMMAILLSAYLLMEKEKYTEGLLKLIDRIFEKKVAANVKRVLEICTQTLMNFVGGQLLEMTILGTIFFAVLSIAQMPYALLISLVIAITSIIPYFGTTAAAIIGAILILADVGLIKAIVFIIIFMVVQWVENNFIYPHVVGSTVGLPAIATLLACSVFGNLFGAFGLIISVPSTAVIFTLIKEFGTAKKVEKK